MCSPKQKPKMKMRIKSEIILNLSLPDSQRKHNFHCNVQY